MKEFNDYFKVILEHEGGFVDHPSDPGGKTNYGISLLFLKGLVLAEGDIDHDGDIDGDDIKALTIEDSRRLYQKFFWDPLHLEKLINEELKLHIFDHGVNAGTRTAVKLLQRILSLQDDGAIGNMTITAANNYTGNIIEEYKKAREKYYLDIIVKNTRLIVFKNGWLNRIKTTNFK